MSRARRSNPERSAIKSWAILTAGRTLLCIAVLAGCIRRSEPTPASAVVKEFVERMRQFHGDPSDAKAIFEMLSVRTNENLSFRAKRYAETTGRPIAPEAMIVPSAFLLRFEPQRYSSRVMSGRTVVEITGPSGQPIAQVPCVNEGERWRVDLALPTLPAVQMRRNAE